MDIKKDIDTEIMKLFKKFRDSSMSSEEIVESLRESAGKSSLLFNFLLERILIMAFYKGYIIISKGMLKSYLKSEHKDLPDYIYIGGTADDESVIKAAHGITIKKGIFIKIIEKLNLNNTLNKYIKFLMIHEPEINENTYLSKEEIKQYSDINSVIEVMYKEFDKKVDANKKIMRLK